MKTQPTSRTEGDLSSALSALARLLEYPGPAFETKLDDEVLRRNAKTSKSGVQRETERHAALPAPVTAQKAVSPLCSATAVHDDSKSPLHQFITAMSALSPAEREELYTTTFDVTPVSVPYVSIHLFGEENFKRGEFMAGLNARYQQAHFDCHGELPDHLAVLLGFAAETDEAERRELVEFCLLGPLAKMIKPLTEENPYRALLEAVRNVLQGAYPGMKPAASPLEQMQQHGAGCAMISAGCGCGEPPDRRSQVPTESKAIADQSVENFNPSTARNSKRPEARVPAKISSAIRSTH